MLLFLLFVVSSLFTFSQSCTGTSAKLNSMATNLNTFKIDTDQQAQYITVPSHSTFFIQIPGNPTTGYWWTQVSTSTLKSVDSDYAADQHAVGMVGVGGCWIWRFDTDQAQNYLISFVNEQGSEVSAVQNVTINVTVKDQ